jgi:HEAT repeat protein
MRRTTCLLFGLCVVAWGVTGSLAVAGEADKNTEQEVYRLLLALPTGYEIKPENMATLARLEALGDQITPHLRTALLSDSKDLQTSVRRLLTNMTATQRENKVWLVWLDTQAARPIAELVAGICDASASNRQEAAATLVLFHSDKAPKILIDLWLSGNDGRNRLSPTYVGYCGVHALKEMTAMLGVEKDTARRKAIVYLLRYFHDSGAASLLAERMKDTEDEVRSSVVDALVGLIKNGSPDKQPLAELLRSALQDRIGSVRADAISAIVKIQDTNAVPALIRMLDQGQDDASLVAQALGNLKQPQAVDVLIKQLSKGQFDIVRSAATALGEIGDERALPALFEAFKRVAPGDWAVSPRAYIGAAIGRFNTPEAIPVLEELLTDTSTSHRMNAAWRLGERKVRSSVPALINALAGEKNTEAKNAFGTVLKKITAQNLGEDADAWRNWWNANGKSER